MTIIVARLSLLTLLTTGIGENPNLTGMNLIIPKFWWLLQTFGRKGQVGEDWATATDSMAACHIDLTSMAGKTLLLACGKQMRQALIASNV